MAKRLRFNYTFFPSTKTIVLDGNVSQKRLLLITNLRTNQIIYNFSDPTYTAVSFSYDSVNNQTTIVLSFNTTSMINTDPLQIITEDDSVSIKPEEILYDPVNKFRTSNPQALIDTDFEYGTQITKWENLTLVNHRPFVFNSAIGVGTINYMVMRPFSRIVEVGLQNAAPGVGTAISVQDTFLAPANGNFLVEAVSGAGNTIFYYSARSVNTTNITGIADTNKTGIFSGTTYDNARIGGPISGFTTGTTGIVTITTTVPHGLAVGNRVAIRGVQATTSGQGNNPPNGSFAINGIPNSTSVSIASTIIPLNPTGGELFVIPQGQVLHRPFDGGVIFSANAVGNFESVVRQTRRYFRYQSGKGIQVSSGTILKPNLQVDSITSVGVAASVITKEQHNIQPGTTVTIGGCNETAYNGSFNISSLKGFNSFEYTMTGAASSTVASGTPYVTVSNWYGASNRLGIFDDQNGLFFEFDGQTLYAVRRNSTFQISGRMSVVQGSNTVTQTDSTFPCFFTKQLQIGNFIVIRGQSYRVIDISSDTSLTISPSYRGASADYVIVSKTVDTKVPQSQWNLDKCDGTGPSGYNIDLGKMQMFYIDYSWYGAGFIRWGFRGQDGNVIYVHKLANNNVNSEAYMRSGNLPGRYESQAIPPTTQLNRTVLPTDTFIGVTTTTGFPTSGTLVIRDAATYEYVNYTGIGTTAFTNVTRAKAGGTTTLTASLGSNSCTSVGSTTNIQVGMRAVHPSIPDGAWVSGIGINALTLSHATTGALSGAAVTFAPMGVFSPQTFNYSPNNPAAVELAYPTFSPTISHWGTSVIMDGRFDDDKSLVFTYGQSNSTSIPASGSRALFSIRVAPSVDNSIAAGFGQRELINRMQLTLKSLDLTTSTGNANLLVRGYLNGVPSTSTPWTNAVGNVQGAVNSSLAQIADYAGGSTTVTGGEVTAGFFVGTGANSIDLSNVRDLGNSILGGGGSTSNTQIYPNGPDTLTIVVTNLNAVGVATVFGRLSWTEAQA